MSDLYGTTTETYNSDALFAHFILSVKGAFRVPEDQSSTADPGTDEAIQRVKWYAFTALRLEGVVANIGMNLTASHVNPQPDSWSQEGWTVRLRRVQGLEDYLNQICDQGLISGDVRDEALRAWSALSAATHNALMVPDACPGEEGDLLLTWDRGDHHLELELVQGGPAIFFFTDQVRGMPWEIEFQRDEPLERSLLSALALFTSPAR